MEKSTRNSCDQDALVIARGAGIVLFGAAAGNMLRYAGHVLAGRYLGPEIFGLLVLGLTIMSASAVIAELGFSSGMVRYVSLYRGMGDVRRLKGTMRLGSGIGLISGLVAAAILFWAAPTLAVRVFKAPELIPVLRVLCGVLPFLTLTSVFAYILQGLKALVEKVFIKDLFDSSLKIVLIGLVVLVDGKLKGILLSYLAAGVTAVILARLCLKRLESGLFSGETEPIYEARKLFRFSWPMIFVQIIGHLLLATDTFMLGLLRSPEDVGIYGAAQKTALLCGMVLNAFLAVFAPVMADHINRKNREETQILYKLVSKWSFSLTVPLSLLLMVSPRPITRVFGADFEPASLALSVLAAGWLFHSLLGCAGTLLTMSGRSKLHLLNFACLFFGNIVLNGILIPRFGILGAALATALTIVLVDILTVAEVRILFRMSPFRTDIWKPLAAGIFSAALVHLLTTRLVIGNNAWHVVVSACVLIGLYPLVIIGLGIADEDRLVIARVLRKIKGK
ncbi:MAG: flippase [Acidobacteriota bacterium]|nr:flippase [Acidobacteriota bacterium]